MYLDGFINNLVPVYSMISNKYKITEQLGHGNFGSVFKGENIRTNEKVAIKIMAVNDKDILIHEAKIYNLLGNINYFPRFKWFGYNDDRYYLVMNLLGESLSTFKKRNHRLSEMFVAMIGEQMIKRLQTIHKKGIIHRDIKPSNFVFGTNSDSNIIFLIDYGFSKGYIQNDNKHMSMKKTNNIIGTLNYISLNVHKKYEPSRRDDIESVCYILMYLLDVMSWDKYKEPSVSNILKIIDEKENIVNCKNIPFFIRKMIEYVRELKFEEEPDYSLLISYIRSEQNMFSISI